ncbi:hypothetical protein [Ectothiorhodospira mobilis]|uniref:hypothetical protein n=1 Tax=Ectothiorhodospira mobilis TaxID=195064 RepID=UPI001904E893|nr:hypothetical protein [Ectothiorhodospira mobilis]MBK1690932.1 hypothetical protein [Ectothiorhodospira mobilis]
MYALIRPFVQLILMRQGPEDLPASALLMWLCVLAYLVLGLVVTVPFFSFQVAVLQSGMELGLLALFSASLLNSRGLRPRFVQTFTALLGVGVLMGLLMLPLVYSLRGAENPQEIPALATIAYLILLGWLLTVYGHILRSALDLRSLSGGIALAVFYLILTAVAGEALFHLLSP